MVVKLGFTIFISRSFLHARMACLKPDSLSDMQPCNRWWNVSAVMGAPFVAISSTREKAVSKSPQRPKALIMLLYVTSGKTRFCAMRLFRNTFAPSSALSGNGELVQALKRSLRTP